MTVFNPLSHIMSTAHWNAHYRRVSGDKRSYPEIFREQLRLSWQRWNTQQEAKRNWQVRQALRDDSNINGLPLATCGFDLAKRHSYTMRSTRAVAAIGA